jgi:replicative DNA helicase
LADSGARVPIRELCGQRGFAVWATDPGSFRLVRAEVSAAFSTGVKPVRRLRTQLGRQLRATANHRFLTLGGWRRLDELVPGDRIALPRRLPEAAAPQQLRGCELALLGHLIGDGCTLLRHAIQYTTREEDLALGVADLARECFGDAVVPRVVRERGWFQVYLASARHLTHGRRSVVAEWLDELGGVWGRRSYEKRLPTRLFMLPAPSLGLFLRHLWATDGCVRPARGTSRAPALYYATSSEGLAGDVQALLLRLGVNARVERHPQRGKGRDQFHVRVSGRSQVELFASAIGAVGAYKRQCLSAVVGGLPATENINRDVIPSELWNLYVRPRLAASGISQRQLHAAIGTAYCGSTLYRHSLGRERAMRVAAAIGSEALRALAESDLYWDRIATIEPAGEEEVFDLTVPGAANFVAAEVVVHNSIEQDADLVAFVYRDEIYNPDDPGKKGLAELIVAKHRNGETGTIELVFLGETTTFKNRAPDHYGGGPPS